MDRRRFLGLTSGMVAGGSLLGRPGGRSWAQVAPAPRPGARPAAGPPEPPTASAPGVSARDVKIGMSAAFKGTQAGLGTELWRGAAAYYTELNVRGAKFEEDMGPAVSVLRQAGCDAVLCTGAYQGCGAFVRAARDVGWTVPISNVSFVGSDAMLALLLKQGKAAGRDYTRALVNSQVVPSYDDATLPGVAEYRALMDKHNPVLPEALRDKTYTPQRYSFISLEGFINAKVVVEGLRFAVVADEVRKLAERSAKATKDIAVLIKNVQSDTQEAVVVMEQGTQEVESGYRMTVQAGESLKAIADVSHRSAELAQDISQATQQQVRGAESVAQAMQSIQAVAAQTERGVLEARRSVDELARLAEELTASLARFKLAA